MQRILRLEGAIQSYDWGSRTILAALQGKPGAERAPEAELWLGAHPNGSGAGRAAPTARACRSARGSSAIRAACSATPSFARFGRALPVPVQDARGRARALAPGASRRRAGARRLSRASDAASVASAGAALRGRTRQARAAASRTRASARSAASDRSHEIRAGFERMGLGDLAPSDGAAEGEWLRAFFARWFARRRRSELRATRLERALDAAARAGGERRERRADAAARRAASGRPRHPRAAAAARDRARRPARRSSSRRASCTAISKAPPPRSCRAPTTCCARGSRTKRRAADELLRIGRFASRRPQRAARRAASAPGVSVYATPAARVRARAASRWAPRRRDRRPSAASRCCSATRARCGSRRSRVATALALATGESCLVPAAVGALPPRRARAGSIARRFRRARRSPATRAAF